MKEPIQNLGFCRLPFELLADSDLTVSDAVVYAVLLDACVNELCCTVALSTIVKLSGLSNRAVHYCLDRLEQCEYIEREHTGRETIYKLADIIGLKRQKSKPTIRQTKFSPAEPEQGQQEMKLLYGDFKTVALTVEQFDKLVSDFGEAKTLEYIRKLDEYAHEHGKQYPDCEFTIRKWIAEDAKKPKPTYRRNGKPVHDIIHEQEMEEISKYLELVD